jgi:fibronectin-binding autotransporter adhesin
MSLREVGGGRLHHSSRRRVKNTRAIRRIQVACATIAAAAATAHATQLYWDPSFTATGTGSGGTGTWDLATGNWYDGVSTDLTWTDTTGTADTANFDGTAGTVTLNTNLGALGLVFGTTGYTISGTGTLSLGTSGIDTSALTGGTTTIATGLSLVGPQSWVTGVGSTLSFNGPVGNGGNLLTISGTGSVVGGSSGVLSGTGGLAITGAAVTLATATYSGTTTISSGSLKLSGASFGSGSITDNGTLYLNNGSLSLANNISGSGGITSLQNAILSGTNSSFSGPIVVSAGTLAIGAAVNASGTTASLGSPSSITVASGGTLALDPASSANVTISAPVTLSGPNASGQRGTFQQTNGAISTITFTGGIAISNGATYGSYGVGETTNFNSVISGSGGLTFNVEGGAITSHTYTANFNASNTYTGNTTLDSGGGEKSTYSLGVSNALPATTVVTLQPGTTYAGSVVLNLNSHNQTFAGLVTAGTAPVSGTPNSTVTGGGTLTLTNGSAYTYAGGITGASTALVLKGTSSQTLSGTSSYSGGTVISSGTLILTGNTDVGTGSVVVSGGTLQLGNGTTAGNTGLVASNTVTLNGTPLVLESVQSAPVTYAAFPLVMNGNASITFENANTQTANFASPITLSNSGGQTATINETSAQNTLNLQGVVSGTGNLTITPGSGGTGSNLFNVTINQAETYTGNTTVTDSGGDRVQLELLSGGSLPSSTVLTINGGASLTAQFNMNGQNQTITGLLSGGTTANAQVVGGGTLTIAPASGSNYSFAGVISGATALTVNGSPTGVQTLTASNTFTGATTVSGGTLSISGSGKLASTSGLTVASGANFQYSPSTPGTLTIGGGSATLTLNNGSTLTEPFGDTIAVQGAGSVTGNVNVNLTGSFSSGTTYTVLTAGSGLPTTSSSYVLDPTNYTYTSTATATSFQVTPTSTTALATEYWLGTLSGAPGVWAASDGVANSNWAADATGTATPLVPGATANVIFSAAGAANQGSMTLGSSMSVNSITVDGTGASPNETNALTLASTGGYTLTIGSTTGSGITVNPGSAAVTLSPNIVVGNAQTWTNNSGNTLTLGGTGTTVVNGANLLTIAGTGATTLNNFNGASGGLSISSSGNPTVTLAGATVLTGAQTWTNNSTNTLTVAGTSPTLATGGYALSLTGTGNTSISSVISGSGAIATTGTGVLTLSGANTFTGGLSIQQGTVVAGVSNATTVSGAAGPSTVAISLGATGPNSNSASLLANSFTVSNPINVNAGSTGTLAIGNNGTTTAAVFSGAVTLANNLTIQDTGTTGTVTVTGSAITGSGNLTLQNNTTTPSTAAGITIGTAPNFSGTITNSGTAVTPNFTGSGNAAPAGSVNIPVALPATVTSITQNSTSDLVLTPTSAYTGSITIASGRLDIGASASAVGSLGSGGASNTVTLGNSSSNATLDFGARINGLNNSTTTTTYGGGNVINVSGTGLNVISDTDYNATVNAPIAFTGNGGSTITNLTVATANSGGATVLTFTGGVTGTGNLTVTNNDPSSASDVVFMTNPVNNVGSITYNNTPVNGGQTNASTAGTNTITGGVGSNVTAITQASFQIPVTISGTAITTNSGGTTLTASGTALFTVSGGVGGTGPLILNTNNNSTALTISGSAVTTTGQISNTGTGSASTVVSANITGTGASVLQNSASSGLNLSGANSYTGATTASVGTLTVSGAGTLTGTSGLTVGPNGVFGYSPSTAGTLTIGGGSATLTMAAGGTLTEPFADTIAVGGAASLAGTVNIAPTGAFTSGTTYTVLTAGSGLPTSGGYNIVDPTNFTYTLSESATQLQITPTTATALTTAYWLGTYSGGAGVWSLSNGSSNSNWASASTGTATALVPAAATNVIFSATGASNQSSMSLGSNMSVNSITVDGSTTPTETHNLVLAAGNTLTIGSTTSPGITINAGSGTVTLNPNIALGILQTWTNNSSSLFTVGGDISGSFALTVAGTGNTSFSGIIGTGSTLTKTGTGTLSLSNSNALSSFDFNNTAASQGTVILSNGTALGADSTAYTMTTSSITGASTGLIELTNNITVNNKAFNLGGRNVGNYFLENLSGNNTWNGNLGVGGGGGGYYIDLNSGTLTLGGTITQSVGGSTRGFEFDGSNASASAIITGTTQDSASSAYLDFTVNTAGSVTLAQVTSTNTGGVTLDQGTLNLNMPTALVGTGGGGGTFVIAGGTIDSTATFANQTLTANNPMTWNGNFAFTGTNNLNLGTGAVSLGSTSGTRTVTVNANTLTVGGNISNGTATSLTKAGSGTLALGGSSSYTGGTTINAGTIRANGALSLGTGAVTVASGGTLGGSGAVGNGSNLLTVQSGGTIAAGSSSSTYGTLTSGSDSWQGGGKYLWKISTAGTGGVAAGSGASGTPGQTSSWDYVTMSSLNVSTAGVAASSSFTIVPTATLTTTNGQYSWILAQVAGTANLALPSGIAAPTSTLGSSSPNLLQTTPTSGLADAFALNTAGFTVNGQNNQSGTSSAFSLEFVNIGGNDDLVLDYSATPEPGTAMLVLGGAAPLLLGRRRRKAAAAKKTLVNVSNV